MKEYCALIFNGNKIAFWGSLLFPVLLFLLLWLTPVAFSAFRVDDSAVPFWHWLSESAGRTGSVFVVLAIGLLMLFHRNRPRQRVVSALAVAAVLAVFISGIALFNEYVMKGVIEVPRPNVEYLDELGILKKEDYYRQEKDKRGSFLQQKLKEGDQKVDHIDPRVLEHWMLESGYSFPSGHAQNAFLLGVILAFLIDSLIHGPARWLALLPLVWAVLVCLSRVAIGVHTGLDVSAGALSGTFLGLGMVYAALKWNAIKPQNI